MHLLPSSRQLSRLPHDPAIDLLDQPVLLGGGEEPDRRDDRPVAVDHPQQQLVRDDLASVHVDDRLRIEHQAILIQRVTDPTDPGQRLQLPPVALLVGPAAR